MKLETTWLTVLNLFGDFSSEQDVFVISYLFKIRQHLKNMCKMF